MLTGGWLGLPLEAKDFVQALNTHTPVLRTCGGLSPANSQTPAQPLTPSPFLWDAEKTEGMREDLWVEIKV